MSDWMQKRLVVARWEFMRYFKWRSELISLLIAGAVLAAVYGGVWLMGNYKADQRFEVAAVGLQHLGLAPGEYQRLMLSKVDAEDTLRAEQALASGELDGLLIIDNAAQARLQVDREAGWQSELQALLNQAAQQQVLSEAGLSAEQFQTMLQPLSLQIELTDGETANVNARRFAMVVLGLMLFALFNSFAYYFASITSEKQQRVCEQILSVVPAQVWVDGKIAGLTLYGAKALLNVAVWAAVGLLVFGLTSGSMPDLSGLMPGPGVVLVVVLFALLGLLFWNSALAAVASTIDDPNSSSRSSLMMLPMVPVILVFFALDISSSAYMVAMSWFPPTAWVAMPARHVIDGVALWQLLGSLALMLAAVWWMRGAAGRLFSTGILMYGQEPGWRDMGRALISKSGLKH